MRMDKIVKIITVHPYQERTYTDKNGEQKVWKTKGFTFRHGKSQFYAEADGSVAEALKDFYPNEDREYVAYVTMRVREYTDGNGVVRVANEIRLDKLAEL